MKFFISQEIFNPEKFFLFKILDTKTILWGWYVKKNKGLETEKRIF